jgi:hypothetical protein
MPAMRRLALALLAAATAVGRPSVAAQTAGDHPAEHGRTRPVHVRVVDEDRRPVPGAAVKTVDLHDVYSRAPELALACWDIGELCARFGRDATTDADGLFTLSACAAGGLVRASKDGRSALLDFDHHAVEGEHDGALARTLVLRQSLELAVRVVDGEGHAVPGVPVALRERSDGQSEDFLCATADADGVARFADLGDVFEDGVVPTEVELCVGLALLLPTAVELPLSPGALPRATLELVLPPTGSLDVELVGPDGGVLLVDALIEVALARAVPADADEAWRREYLPDRTGNDQILAFARSGRLVLERVGPGLELEFEIAARGGYRVAYARAVGPRGASERATLRVTLEPLVALAGTLIAPGGALLASRGVHASLGIEKREGGSARIRRRLETDARGRFELHFAPEWPLDVTCALELWSDDVDGTRGWLRLERDGPGELGEVVLDTLPLLAGGRVLGTDGEPIPGVVVELVSRPERFEEGWIDRSPCDADGRFALQAPCDLEEVELVAHADGYVTRGFRASTGSRDLAVALERGGGIRGSVRVHASALEALEVRLMVGSEIRSATSLEQDGGFELLDESPGSYDVVVSVVGEDEPAVFVPAVEVRAGEVASDPRLAVLDLTGIVRTFELTLVHPANDPYARVLVRRRPSGSGEFRLDGDWSLTDPMLTTRHAALDLLVTAEGCRTVELLGVAEGRTVELPPALRLDLVVEPPLALGEHEWLEVELKSRAGAPLRTSFAPRFHDGRNAEALVHEPGPYAVRVVFLQQAVGDLRATPLPLEPEVVIDVADAGGPQRFVLALGAAALREVERARADPPPRTR